MKYCKKCSLQKTFVEFGKDKTEQDGFSDFCKKCNNISQKKWRDGNPVKKREQAYKWNEKNPERTRRNHLYNSSLKRDKNKGFVICSKKSYFAILDVQVCFYCGIKGLIGVDRIDNSKGHIEGNMLPCCKECNYSRGRIWSLDEMLLIGSAIRKIRRGRGDCVISDDELVKFQGSKIGKV